MLGLFRVFLFFFFNDTATTEIYTLSLHDALPICIDTGAEIGNGIVEGQAAAVGVIARGGGTYGDYGRLLVHLVRSERAPAGAVAGRGPLGPNKVDRKSTRLNSSHSQISYAVFCLKKKKRTYNTKVIT